MERGERGELRLLSGESHTRILGDEVSLRVSSSLMGVASEAGGVAAVAALAEAILGKSKESIVDDTLCPRCAIVVVIFLKLLADDILQCLDCL